MFSKVVAGLVFFSSLMALVSAQTISFTSVPNGFEAGSIELGAGFVGALAPDPYNPDIIYAAVGVWQQQYIVKINLADSTVASAAVGFFGSIGGMAVPAPHQLIVVDNDDYTSNTIPGEMVLLLTDKNMDGDFDDIGEVEPLIAPLLVDGASFSGAQARIAPAGNPSDIPSGSLLFQNADGGGKADLFVVTNPTDAALASYRPEGGAYFSGYDYNGGFDFDSQGRIFMGATNSWFSGEVFSLVNLNNDMVIDAGEANDVVTSLSLSGGISDLIIDGDDNIFLVTNPWDGYQVQKVVIPADPLHETATPSPFANTDSSWLTTIMINTKTRPFKAGQNDGAIMLLGGYKGWSSATNLLILKPCPFSEVEDWAIY